MPRSESSTIEAAASQTSVPGQEASTGQGVSLDTSSKPEATTADQSQTPKHHSHHDSLGEKIAHEHDALRAAGRESAQALVLPVSLGTVGGTSTVDTTRSRGEQLNEHILSFLLTSSKKKGVVTDDAELAEFMRQHPELSQYIKELQQAREAALRNAESKQDPLQSRDNLLAKLDVIATLLEGSPLAPALRMGDVQAKAMFSKLAEKELGEEAAPIAEAVWDKARIKSIDNSLAEARDIARQSAALLALPESMDDLTAQGTRERRAAFEGRMASQFGADSTVTRHILAELRLEEDRARAILVSQRVWQLEVNARVHEARPAEESKQAMLKEYLASQQDLLTRNPAFAAALAEHRGAARERGRELREAGDFAARELFRAVDGLGTYENVIFKTLEGRSLYELEIIRQRYQEMYGELLYDRLDSELSGSAWQRAQRAYLGDSNNRGLERAELDGTRLAKCFSAATKTSEVLVSQDRALGTAVAARDIVQESTSSVLALRSLILSSGLSTAEFIRAQRELGTTGVLEDLRSRASTSEIGGQPTLATQRDRLGLEIVQATLQGAEVSDEALAQYAALAVAEYGKQIGAQKAEAAPDKQLLDRIELDRAAFLRSAQSLCAQYPQLAQQLDLTTRQYEEVARQAAIEAQVRSLGTKIGLLYGEKDAGSVRRRESAQAELSRYLAAQQDFLSVVPGIAQQIDQAQEAGIQQGISTMEQVRRSVSQLYSGISGLGTNEARCYAALQGRSPQELGLIKKLYKEKHGETLELALEGDFSSAELDKVHGLLARDYVGVAAADSHLALNGFWGVDHETLRSALRSLATTEERERFTQRFDSLYAKDYYVPVADGEGEVRQARNFAEALSVDVHGDNLIVATSLLDGNFNRADAALVHLDVDSTWSARGEQPALRLEAMKRPDGHLDMARIGEIDREYSMLYGKSLSREAAAVSGAEGKWFAAVVDGREIDAGAHKLRHAMGGSFDGTDEKLIRQVFKLPPELEARVKAEDRRGERSPETEAALQHWSELRAQISRRYAEPDMYPDRDLIGDLRDELNDHEFHVVKILLQDGKLSKADLIFDACDGAGTDEQVVREETAGLSKAEAQALIADFKRNGYGDLIETLKSELSGDDEFDVLENMHGRPETALEMYAAGERRAKHEDSGILSVVVWGDEREEMLEDLRRLREATQGRGDPHEIDALYRRLGVSAEAFRDQKNHVSDVIVNAGTTVILVGGTVVMIVGSLGTAAPGAVALWSVYLAGIAGGVRMGTKWAIRGEGYGIEEWAVDGGVMLVDIAAVGVMSKVPVGRVVAGKLEVMIGEAMAERGAIVLAEDGTRVTGDALFSYLAQSSRSVRIVVGAAQGSIDGAIFAPMQASAVTALQEQTWDDGFGKGLERMGEAGLRAAPAGMLTGGVVSGAAAIRTPAYIANGKPISVDKAADLIKGDALSEAGREVLIQREASKGFITRGDVADAAMAGQSVGAVRSKELLGILRSSSRSGFSEGDIRLFELKVRTQGSLSQLDECLITGKSPNNYVATISQSEIEKRIVASQQEIARLRLESGVKGLSASQSESLQSSLSGAQDRLRALQDAIRAVEAGNRAAGISSAPAVVAKQDAVKLEKMSGEPVADSPEIQQQREFVSRLEKDLAAHPKDSRVRQVIEESLAEQRTRLDDLVSRARADAQAGAAAGKSVRGSGSSAQGDGDSNPWHYDPSESFARGQMDEGDGYYEPLSRGSSGGTGGPKRGGGGGAATAEPRSQRAMPRSSRLESQIPKDDVGLSPTANGEAVASVAAPPKPAVSPEISPAPSVEEILIPQFDEPLIRPITLPSPALRPTPLSGLAMSRVVNPETRTIPFPHLAPAPGPAPEPSPKPETAPKVQLEEAVGKKTAQKLREGGGPGEPGEISEIEMHKRKDKAAQEDKKRRIELEKSRPRGGGKLKFTKIVDALGDAGLVVESEDRGEH